MSVIPTGIYPLDYALCGGLPIGRVTILYGLENSTKTTTFLKGIAQAQRMCARCYRDVELDGCECEEDPTPFTVTYIDVENGLDLAWATKLGVDTSGMAVCRPPSAEAAIDLMSALLDSGECDLIVLDSMAALEPQAELDLNLSAEKAVQPGAQARLLGQASRKVMAKLNAMETETGHRTTIWMTNQIRYKIGIAYGNPETEPGGKAFDYVSGIKVRLSGKLIQSEKSNEVTHNEVSFKVTKVKRSLLGSDKYTLVLANNPRHKVGESYDEPFILNRAVISGLLVYEKGRGWFLKMPGEETIKFAKQEAIEDALIADPVFKRKLQKVLLEVALKTREG
jgi:recombination protein RecA